MKGKTVLVTGGAKRVGAAIVRYLHAAGANVVIHFNTSESAAEDLQKELCDQRICSASIVRADLLNVNSHASIIDYVIDRFGRLDALVNNASTFYSTPLDQVNENNWNDLIGTNLKVPLFLAKAAAAELRKSHGCIVNIVDIHAERPMRGHLVYSSAKAGLAGLTKGLAQELSPEIRVNGVAPGPIIWPTCTEWKDKEIRKQIIDHTLMKREGDPDDVAKVVKFLISDAPYVAGQIIAVDGGRSVNI